VATKLEALDLVDAVVADTHGMITYHDAVCVIQTILHKLFEELGPWVRVDTLTGVVIAAPRHPRAEVTPKGHALCGWCHEVHLIEKVKTCRAGARLDEEARTQRALQVLLEIQERLDAS
jgi:hypothetical protein